MPEYLSPGVYVEEVDAGVKPIEGVSTSTAGFVGVTERGRVGYPELVTSFAQYLRTFGHHLRQSEYPDAWYLSHAMQGFFTNGGKRAYVVRVLPDGATPAGLTLYDRGDGDTDFEVELAARSFEGDGYLVVDDDSDIGDDDWLLLSAGSDSEYLQVGAAASAVVVARAPLEDTVRDGDDVGFYSIAGTGDGPFDLTADAAAGATSIEVSGVGGMGGGVLLRIDDGPRTEYVRVAGLPGGDVVDLDTPTSFPHSSEAAAGVQVEPLVAEVLEGSTEAVGDALAGSHLLTVADDSAAAASDAIGFGAAPTEFYALGDALAARLETVLAAPAGAGGEVTVATLNAGTAFALTDDADAGATAIEVDDLQDINDDTVLLLDDGNPEAEHVVVDSSPGTPGEAGTVTLRTPLRFPHTTASPATTVDDDTPGPGDGGFPPPTAIVARLARGGDDAVVLSHDGGVAAGAVLRLGGTDPDREYRVIAADDLDIVPLAGPVAAAHLAGTEALGRSAILDLEAIDPGAWGNCLRVLVADDEPLLETSAPFGGAAGDPTLELASGVGIESGTVLEFYDVAGGVETVLFQQKVTGRIGSIVSFGPAGLDDLVPPGTRVRTHEFRLTVECVRVHPRTGREEVDADMSETFRNLSLDPRHSRYVVTVIGAPGPDREGESNLVKVSDRGAATAEDDLRLGPDPLVHTVGGQELALGRFLTGGDDDIGNLVSGDFVGVDDVDPDDRTGLHALKNIEDVNIVAMPGRTAQVEQNALVNHCVEMRYRVAVLDSRPGDGIAEVQEHRNLYDTRYAALYYPWLQIPDPFPRNPRAQQPVDLPPSGHVIGIYARSDNTRGVHKAPANEVVRGITGIEVKLTKGEHDVLNPRNINVIRDFREQGRAIRVWGARVVTSESDWRYLNVRRLFNFVEHSLDRGTQWVVFEPNDHRLWARLGQSVSSFLSLLWKEGALMGRTPEEAYFVKADETTMTQDDIDAGRLVMLIGIAPVKPAEFVIIRIGQWAGGSSVQEL